MPFLFLLALQTACVEVAGDRITAGDLAPVIAAFQRLDSATSLGYSPAPGIVRWLGRREMAVALGAAATPAELPPRICIVRKTVKPSEEALATAMKKVLPPDASLSILRLPAADVPEGEHQFPLSGIRSAGQHGVYCWTGRVLPAGGGRSVTLAALVQIRLHRRVLIAQRSLPAGSIITAGDLAAEIREVGWPPPPEAPDPAALEGWKTRRSLEAGQVVDHRWLVGPLTARPGSPVVLAVERAGAKLRIETQALTGGRLGDTILVKGPFAATKLRARLTGPGEAVLTQEASVR